MSKEERNELKRKLKRIEDKGDSPDITIKVMPNLKTGIPSTYPDEHLPMEHFEEETARDFTEMMM
jgi:hypothetical protein